MKVKELISKLQDFDGEKEVKIGAGGCCFDILEIDELTNIILIEAND
jgi:hypothetical protein